MIVVYIIIMAFVAIYFYINIFLAGMTWIGFVMNIIGLLVLCLYYKKRNPKYIVTFFFLNILLGPFFVVNLDFAGLPNLGRLDFLFGILLTIEYFRNDSNYKIKRIFRILVISIVLLSLINIVKRSTGIDVCYNTLSGVFVAYGMYIGCKQIIIRKLFFKNGLLYLLLLHIIISILQMFVPLNIRSGTIESALTIGKMTITRPVGLLENSYVYGINTMALTIICYMSSSELCKSLIRKLLPFIVAICFISTRTIIIGVLVYFVISYLSTASHRVFYIIMIVVSFLSITYVVISNFANVLIVLDASNATKFLLWGNMFLNFFTDIDSLNWIVGAGFDSSQYLAMDVVNYANAIDSDIRFDNRIDGKTEFKIHNEYFQILYECGIPIFLYYLGLIYQCFKKSIGIKNFTTLFFCVASFNYFLHNGFFSDLLIFSIFLVFSRINSNSSVNHQYSM